LRDVTDALNDRIEDVSDDVELAKDTGPSKKTPNTDPKVLELMEDVSELIENIDGIVGCLVRLVPNLCDPFPLDLYSRDARISDAYPDIDLARELFPRASLALVDRLGRANWKRRQYLKMIQEKSHPGIPVAKAKKSANRQKKSVLREVAVDAFNFQKPTLKVGSLQPQTNHWPGANRSIYDTSAAPSVVDTEFSRPVLTRNDSFTSLAQSEIPVKRLLVPKPPIPLERGQNFLCLYCRNEIDVNSNMKTVKDWESHVFRDLEPYLCTFNDCLRADKTYGARDDWFRHELESHRIMKVWVCQACEKEFITKEKFEAHLQEKHENVCGPSQLTMMVSLCMKHSQKHLEEQICPLCAERIKAEVLKVHISDHLEQLALTSVNGDESSEEDDTDEIVSKFDDTASEGRTKLQILSAFAEEQFGYIHPGGLEPPDKGLGATDLDFIGDSEEEDSQGDAKRPVSQNERSWGVSHLLGDQPAEQMKTDQDPIKRSRSPRVFATGLNIPGPRSSESAISQPLVRTASYPYNDDFIGRDSDLANLYKILSVSGRLCIVSGTGGMGKTATAVEFTYRYEQTFNCIFWVQAETRVGLADTYSLIATQLGLALDGTDQERVVELSREFLDKTEKRWLLVFDNVDNWADIEDYLPEKTSQTNGSILITTRNPELAPSPIPVNYYLIILKELRMEEGRSLLIKGLRSDLKHEHVQRHPEYRIAGEIAGLAGLPLAIIHISGYVKASSCTLAEFWELWNEWRRNNLPSGATDDISNSDSALETVWNIGLRELGVDALKVLKIMAFLDSDAIQKELLINDHAARSLAFLNSSNIHRYDCSFKIPPTLL
jgi:NB-ARC domain